MPDSRAVEGRKRFLAALAQGFLGLRRGVFRHFVRAPRFWIAFIPSVLVASLAFMRSPASNFIFDEQEALLANPYVNGNRFTYLQAFQRDFWGLPPERTIGSYRPIPNLIWRPLWAVMKVPWLPHFANVLIHAANASLLGALAFAVTRQRRVGWLTGAVFLLCALLTEAICGVVGLADVLSGLSVLLALCALRLRLVYGFLGVFSALLLGLFSKESAIVAVPLVFVSAVVLAPSFFPERPRRLLRGGVALAAAVSALVLYTYLRRRWFPVPLPAELAQPLPVSAPWVSRALHEFLRWFHQPQLSKDPINNPFAAAETSLRIAGALRVYFGGLLQIVAPFTLSADYSFPQELVPKKAVFLESVAGAFALLGAPILGLVVWGRMLVRERALRREYQSRAGALGPLFATELRKRYGCYLLVVLGLIWFPIAYFPHSNIPVLLPTVRAERFWYLPAIGTSLCLGVLFAWWVERRAFKVDAWLAVGCFLGFQGVQARLHALDYSSDLTFWRGTRAAVPYSAKAHLNYSVMLGARGELKERLTINTMALELAPSWPMAHIYQGDTLCRLHRTEEAWPYFIRGFELGPNDPNLIALALQCVWNEKALTAERQQDLLRLGREHPGTWLAYLATDIVNNGKKYNGVDPKYRPRGYNEGPRKE
ncbi:MAG: tetratricopeptide repeat protein [Polyangiaceae bacterium]|nr:tetratricopeptide repeat protein [Polyangiaceae bacterium]